MFMQHFYYSFIRTFSISDLFIINHVSLHNENLTITKTILYSTPILEYKMVSNLI